MTLGERIRGFRRLRGLTQKELGIAVGFPETTADSRIRKYEMDLMKPKKELKARIAGALEVNPAALTEFDVNNVEVVMQFLFLLEETYGMEVFWHGGICMVFSDEIEEARELIWCMDSWIREKNKFFQSNSNITEESLKEYSSWKAQFSRNSR